MNKYLLFLPVACCLIGIGCTKRVHETISQQTEQPQPFRANDYPDGKWFIGGYSDPLTSMGGTNQLLAHANQLLDEIGGWTNVQASLAENLWVYGLNHHFSIPCPKCAAAGKTQPVKMKLDHGKLICPRCGTVVYPSAEYPLNRQIVIDVQGGSYTTKCYRSESNLNLLLSEVRQIEVRQRIINRDGLIATYYMLLAKTHKDLYAERLAELLLGLSRNPPGLHMQTLYFNGNQEHFKTKGAWQKIGGIDFHAKPLYERYWILAYNEMRDYNDAWRKFGDPQALKAHVRQSLIDRHKYYVACMLPGLGIYRLYSNMGNIFAPGLRSMALLALYCDYPRAMLDCAHFLDAESRIYATFDGVESESGSYQAQVVGHFGRILSTVDRALPIMLKSGQLDQNSFEYEYIKRSVAKARHVHKGNLRYPNGDAVRVGDTWGTHSMDKTEFASSRAVPDPAWGYFPICSSNRTYVGLILPPQWFSHHHNDDLSIVLWGSGRELLPDYGYNKAYYRNFSVSISGHNASAVFWRGNIVLDARAKKARQDFQEWEKANPPQQYPSTETKDEPDLKPQALIEMRTAGFAQYRNAEPRLVYKQWRRAAVFQYRPEGLVTWIDAASPGPLADGVRKRSRMLICIPVNKHSSLVVDLHRLAGGDMHQIALHAPFGEKILSKCSAPAVTDRQAAAGSAAFCSRKFGNGFDRSFHCSDYRDASKDWTLRWTGSISGASLKVFAPGLEHAVILNGESPDTTRDPYRGDWHRPDNSPPVPYRPSLFLRRESAKGATPGSLESVIPLVYTHSRGSSDANDHLTKVERLPLNVNSALPQSDQPLALKLEFLSGRTDYIYSACDTLPRKVGPYTMHGRAVWVSQPAANAAPWAAATLRNSSVTGSGLEQKSKPTQKLTIDSASYVMTDGGTVGTFKAHGVIDNPEHYINRWYRVDYGADVSYIYRIRKIKKTAGKNHWVVEFDGRPGLKKTADGWSHTGYPFKAAGTNAVLILNDATVKLSPEFKTFIKSASQLK